MDGPIIRSLFFVATLANRLNRVIQTAEGDFNLQNQVNQAPATRLNAI